MVKRIIDGHFTPSRRYFENTLGREFDFTAATGPYEYLLGALSGCFVSTLLDIFTDDYESVDAHIEGEKREEVPTTLKHTLLRLNVKGVKEKENFRSAVTRASETCSIYQTISKVSEMEIQIVFED